MSEQTANLCTTDACEALRARLAKYEDAEGRPVVDAQRLLDWNRSQPEPRPIVVGREYQVAEACARLNQPASGGDERAAWTVRKPTEEGAYWIRGNGLEADALVQVKHEEGELWCNLHVRYIEPVFEYGYTIEQLSSEFEWLGPLHARAALSAPSHGEQALYTHPADQVAEPDAELVELLKDCRRYAKKAWPDGVHSYRNNSISGDVVARIDAKLASLK